MISAALHGQNETIWCSWNAHVHFRRRCRVLPRLQLRHGIVILMRDDGGDDDDADAGGGGDDDEDVKLVSGRFLTSGLNYNLNVYLS